MKVLNSIHLKINLFITVHLLDFETLITTLWAQLSSQFFHPGRSPYLSILARRILPETVSESLLKSR